MKTTPRILTIALCAAITIGSTFAEEKKSEPSHAKIEVKIPDTAATLWTEIEAKQKIVSEAVTAKKGEGLVEISETLEALVNAVPSKYPDLAADKKKRVEGQIKNVARVLDEMHDAGVDGKWDVAAKKLSQVETAIKLIRQQVGK